MKGFSAVARTALEAKALDTKTKELIALAISVATRCDACVAFHAEAAVQRGAPRGAARVGMAIYVGAGPSMYAAQALEAFDQFSHGQPAAVAT
jgi:AhpD family alkylhydroperoxidase